MKSLKFSAVAFLLLLTACVHAESGRWVDPAQDHRKLPTSGSLLTWSGDDQIIAYRNLDKLMATRLVPAGDDVLELPVKPHDFAALRYQVNGEQYSIDDYMRIAQVGGLLVIKDGQVLLERYGFGNSADSRWLTYSVAKSVTSLLYGAALQDGYIRSIDDKVSDYLPHLTGTAYEQVSIRQMLQMASGVEWDETYADPNSDVATLPTDVLETIRFVGNKERVAAPGERFNYNTGESNLAGAVLRAAIGNNLATYLSHKIWQPFGMEADANWLTHGEGSGERGGCCLSATLRDYGRLGLFAMGGGKLADGTALLPETWMKDSTQPSQGNPGYGYMWWLGKDGYRATGIFGQDLDITPEQKLIIVTLGAWPTAVSRELSAHRVAFNTAVKAELGQ